MKARNGARGQRGVALVLVVWFIAGMALLVGGIVSHARVDTRMTGLHLARAEAIAAGDGAILLAMAEQTGASAARRSGPLIAESIQSVGDMNVRVRLFPAAGFVNVNEASREVLAVLFAHSGALSRAEAQTVADNVVKWRRDVGRGRGGRTERRSLNALEDMLLIEGVTRQLLDGIRDYVVVGSWARGSINWNASPQAVMGLLSLLDPGKADSVTKRREAMMRTADARGGQISRIGSGADSAFRADAIVSYGGKQWLRRRWLVKEASRNSSLPWRVVRTEPPRIVQG